MIGKVSRGKSFSSTLRYVFQSNKKPQLVFANLVEAFNSDLQPLIEVFSNHAALHNRTRRPVYHLSVSPAIEDSLSLCDWCELTKNVIDTLKLTNHQALAVMHRDTYFPHSNKLRPHIHIIANAVGDNGKCANFFL